MKQFIKDMGREALRQLFGLQKPRGGKIVLTRHAVQKMTEHKLDRETLENAFRHGRKGRSGMLQRAGREGNVYELATPSNHITKKNYHPPRMGGLYRREQKHYTGTSEKVSITLRV